MKLSTARGTAYKMKITELMSRVEKATHEKTGSGTGGSWPRILSLSYEKDVF